MRYSIIVLSSVTAAKRAERMALNKGISCFTSHTPKVVAKYGCSHCIKVRIQYTKSVVDICKELNLDIKGVYEEVKKDDNVVYERIGDYNAIS